MNKPLILVVEDDTPVRNLITMTLKTHEYRYLSAQNGASAVMEALSHNPDIVLLDLGLPDMDGVEVIQKIRSWSNMPIIVISARTEDSDKIGALDAGAEDVKSLDDSLEIITEPADYDAVEAALADNRIETVMSEITMVPDTMVSLSDEDAEKVRKIIDMFDDMDDVQEVYTNADLPEEEDED